MARKPKHHNVSVSNDRYMTLDNKSFDAPDSHVGLYQTHDWGKTWSRDVRQIVVIDQGSVEDVIRMLVDACKPLGGTENASLRLDVDVDGDDEGDFGYSHYHPRVELHGMRLATDEEVATVKRYLKWLDDRAASFVADHKQHLIQ